MFHGKILAIQIAPAKKAQPQSVESVSTLPAQGLAGDRYAVPLDSTSRRSPKPDQEVTLIESEAINAAVRDYSLAVSHADTRRNLLTEGVPLNHLVGRSFKVGEVVLRGVELCEPCKYLEKLTGMEMIAAFKHRGGLRAQVISGGTIRVGDTVIVAES